MCVWVLLRGSGRRWLCGGWFEIDLVNFALFNGRMSISRLVSLLSFLLRSLSNLFSSLPVRSPPTRHPASHRASLHGTVLVATHHLPSYTYHSYNHISSSSSGQSPVTVPARASDTLAAALGPACPLQQRVVRRAGAGILGVSLVVARLVRWP